MPEIIRHVDEAGEEHGYLYIAQPPLYKAKRGKSEVYLKDDPALDKFLIDAALEDAVLTLHDGSQRAGADLRATVEKAKTVAHLLEPLTRRVGSGDVVEQAAIAGALDPEILGGNHHAEEAAAHIANRLDALASQHERGWQGEALPDGGLAFTRTLRGVRERRIIDAAVLRSSEARRINQEAADLQATYGKHGALKWKDGEAVITGPISLSRTIMEIGRKGVAIQRYKGLGEMNAEQLWETTLDPESRSLLRVRVSQADEAGHLFETLMGDVVEPRREFIQTHALEVANLDV
jgi:DNA gyrase subunit B